MKKLMMGINLVFIAFLAAAQPPKPPTMEEKLQRTNEMIKKEVQPSASQQTAIEAAFKTFFTQEEKLRKDNPPPPPPPPDPKVKEAMDKLVKERDESIKKVLTAAQYEKYKEAAKKLHPPKPGDKEGLPPPRQ